MVVSELVLRQVNSPVPQSSLRSFSPQGCFGAKKTTQPSNDTVLVIFVLKANF